MTLIYHPMRIFNARGSERMIVASQWRTGENLCVLPESILEKIEVKVAGKLYATLANGIQGWFDYGYCIYEIEGFRKSFTTPTIFGPYDTPMRIGWNLLRNVGIGVNQATGTLFKTAPLGSSTYWEY